MTSLPLWLTAPVVVLLLAACAYFVLDWLKQSEPIVPDPATNRYMRKDAR